MAMDRSSSKGLRSLNELLQVPVRDINGNAIGYIIDVFVNDPDGRLAYVAILLDTQEARDGAEVIVPWSAISHNGDLRIGARAETLRRLSKPVARKNDA
jgi:sporulation protein YlmC with PRC-barrel domain